MSVLKEITITKEFQEFNKNDLGKHFSKKINDNKRTWRFDDFMSSLSNEYIRNNGKAYL